MGTAKCSTIVFDAGTRPRYFVDAILTGRGREARAF